MKHQKFAALFLLFIFGEILALGVYPTRNEREHRRNRPHGSIPDPDGFMDFVDTLLSSPRNHFNSRQDSLLNTDMHFPDRPVAKSNLRQHHHSSGYKPLPVHHPIPVQISCPNLTCPEQPACPACPAPYNTSYCPACPEQHIENTQDIICQDLSCPTSPACPACPPCPAAAAAAAPSSSHHKEECPEADRCEKFKADCAHNFGVYCEVTKKCIIFLPRRVSTFNVALSRCDGIHFKDKSVTQSLLDIGQATVYDQEEEYLLCTQEIIFTTCHLNDCWVESSSNLCLPIMLDPAATKKVKFALRTQKVNGTRGTSRNPVVAAARTTGPALNVLIDPAAETFVVTEGAPDGLCAGEATPICEASTEYCK